MKRINDLHYLDRPRTKLIRNGPNNLSDFELLEVIISAGSGQNSVEKLAQKVLRLMEKTLGEVDYESLSKISGLSAAKVTQILAMIEFAKRYLAKTEMTYRSSSDYYKSLADISSKKQEHLVVLSMDGARRIISRRVVTIGLLDRVSVHPREVFCDSIADRAAGVVVGHNHPSGDVSPSIFDIGLNQQLAAAGQIIGIELIDHIILGENKYYSFKDEGLL